MTGERRMSWRLGLELVLGSLAGWLVVQNLLLLALEPWAARPSAWVAAAAVFKAFVHVVLAMWPWFVFAAITCLAIVTAWLVRLAVRPRAGGIA